MRSRYLTKIDIEKEIDEKLQPSIENRIISLRQFITNENGLS